MQRKPGKQFLVNHHIRFMIFNIIFRRSTQSLFGCALLLSICVLRTQAAGAAVVQLDSPDKAAPFGGWGTSLCWFANAVGKWPEPQRSEIADALFSAQGLHLTVARYNIGGGEEPSHHHMPWFRQMDGYEPRPGEWNWNADAGQRWMLRAAIDRGVNYLEAFSNSPPYWMTLSQCASGGPNPNADNLDPKSESAFVQYLTTVVRHFQNDLGIRFNTLDPFNEPYTDYWKLNGKQEGCHFERTTQSRIIQELRATLDQTGLNTVGIAAADETNYERAIGTWQSYDAKAKACVAVISSHAYATEHRAELSQLARASGKTLEMSEVDGPGAPGHDHASIAAALPLARNIVDDLKDLHPARWIFWQAVEDEAGQSSTQKNWGLIHADLVGKTHQWAFTKKYYVMANFSKFIGPGALMVAASDKDTIAAVDSKNKALVLVIINTTDIDQTHSYNFSNVNRNFGVVELYRTSENENLAKLPDTTAEANGFTATAKAHSVTTCVLQPKAP